MPALCGYPGDKMRSDAAHNQTPADKHGDAVSLG